MECLINYANSKGGKLRKKLEMALNQAKNDIRSLTEKLVAAQSELEDRRETLVQNVRELETKRGEVTKLRKELDESNRKLARFKYLDETMKEKDAELEQQEKRIINLQVDFDNMKHQKESLRQMYDEETGALSNQIADLENQVLKKQNAVDKLKMDMNDSLENLRKDLSEKHSQAMQTMEDDYEERIQQILERHRAEIDAKNNTLNQLDERNEQLRVR